MTRPTVAHRVALGPAHAERLAGDPRYAHLRDGPGDGPSRTVILGLIVAALFYGVLGGAFAAKAIANAAATVEAIEAGERQ